MGFQEKKSHGQSALEFLMNYSWAIMVLLVVVGVLFFLGVLRPTTSAPNTCTIPLGFACKGFKIATNGTLTLRVAHTLPEDIIITAVGCGAGPVADIPDTLIGPSAVLNLTGLPNCTKEDGTAPKRGEYFSGRLVVEFKSVDTGFVQRANGTITYRVE